MTRTPTYKSWSEMRQRCVNGKKDNYKYYGGRGITVCKRWSKFENFLADLGPRPSSMTLDRRDQNGNYTPENCRWATRLEQANNARSNRLLMAGGTTMTMSEAGRRFGISVQLIQKRLDVLGWPEERAATQPARPDKRQQRSSINER